MADQRQATLDAQNLERSMGGAGEGAGMVDQGGRPPNPMEPTRPNGNPVQGPAMRPMRRSLPGGMGPAMTQAVRQGGDQL